MSLQETELPLMITMQCGMMRNVSEWIKGNTQKKITLENY